MEAIHFDLLAASPLDFRDAQCLAMTCEAAKVAFRKGRLQLIADTDHRILTTRDLSRIQRGLVKFENVCILRLDQQPRSLWPPPGQWDTVMRQMPYPSSGLLEHLSVRCRNLEELSLHGWVSFTGASTVWNHHLVAALRLMPQLRRVAAPINKTPDGDGSNQLGLETLIDTCTHLTQLHVQLPFMPHVVPFLEHVQIGRLLHLSLYCVGPHAIRLLHRCTNLRRLHIDGCALHNVDLSSALPASLRVLTFVDCEGPPKLIDEAQMAERFGRLELLSFCVPYDSSQPVLNDQTRTSMHHMWVQPFMRVLELSNVGVTDQMLRGIAERCPLLDTLLLGYVNDLTVYGLSILLDLSVLPKLRAASFTNESYADGLDEFFVMSREERIKEHEDEIGELQRKLRFATEGTWDEVREVEKEIRLTDAFFMFVRAVTTRSLVVPLQAHNRLLLPRQLHPLQRDYFHLGIQ